MVPCPCRFEACRSAAVEPSGYRAAEAARRDAPVDEVRCGRFEAAVELRAGAEAAQVADESPADGPVPRDASVEFRADDLAAPAGLPQDDYFLDEFPDIAAVAARVAD